MSKGKDSTCCTQFLTLIIVLTLLLAGCSNSPATVAAPPVPTSTVELPLAPTKAPSTNAPTVTPLPTSIATSEAYWPTQGWRTSAPEEQGLDAQKLAAMLKAVQEKNLNLHSLLIIRNGYLVSETYFGSYQQDTRHELYSCTKSFIATLIGIALDKGYLKGTDQRILDFFPEQTFANPEKLRALLWSKLTDQLGPQGGFESWADQQENW